MVTLNPLSLFTSCILRHLALIFYRWWSKK